MNNIVKRENQSVNIDRLDAQRHLYSKVKTYTYLVVILCVLNPVLLAIAKVVFSKMDVLVKITVVYSFVIVFFKPLLNNCISKLQALAARIQQLFDCDVFELAWNEPLCGTKPAPEEVFKARTNKGIEEFRNWYKEAVVLLDRLPGIIVCQRTNVFYDRNLRNIYGKAVNVMFCIAFLLVFFIGFFQNPHLWDFFLKVIVPLSPIVSWMIDFKKQNKLSLSALKRLDSLVNKALDKLYHGEQIDEQVVAQIQNYIFLHRKSSYPVPDFIYAIRRKSSEAATHYSVDEIVNKLIHE